MNPRPFPMPRCLAIEVNIRAKANQTAQWAFGRSRYSVGIYTARVEPADRFYRGRPTEIQDCLRWILVFAIGKQIGRKGHRYQVRPGPVPVRGTR